jgi:hypothetical protein
MEIYEFQVQEGFEWVLPVDSADFDVFRSLDGRPRAAEWKPVRMELLQRDEGKRLRPSDMPWLGKHAPVLRERAVASLGPLLAPFGEFLPLDCDDADLVVFHTTTVLDALDFDRSTMRRRPSGNLAMLGQVEFRREMVAGVHAFKIPQFLRGPVFVSQDVVAAAQAARLRGVGFQWVWDDHERHADLGWNV